MNEFSCMIQLTGKNLQLLGQMLLKKRPEVANELLTECMEQMNAPVKDTSLIGYYFESYCRLNKIDVDQFRDSKKNHSVSQKKKEFIGLILKIYHPYIFRGKCDFFKAKNGLITNLANTLNISRGNASELVQEIYIWISTYEDFRNKVCETYQIIIGEDGQKEVKNG